MVNRSNVDFYVTRIFGWLEQHVAGVLVNIVITVIIFVSTFYGLTAFLTQRRSLLENSIIFSLHNGPIRLEYNFENPLPPIKTFVLSVPRMDVSKYSRISFSIRGKEEGTPGIVKVIIRNQKNEVAAYYLRGIGLDWKDFNISLKDFKEITDWTTVKDVSFILESWNVDNKRGMILIDDVCFSSQS